MRKSWALACVVGVCGCVADVESDGNGAGGASSSDVPAEESMPMAFGPDAGQPTVRLTFTTPPRVCE